MELDPSREDYVLYVDNLSVEYSVGKKRVFALSNVSFGIRENEAIGIVGESGCGKSTLALAIAHILPVNAAITSGKVVYRGQTIVDQDMGGSFSLRYKSRDRKIEESLKIVRWKGISIVFQGALDSMNPLFTVGDQLSDIFVYKEKETRENALRRSEELLKAMGLDPWVLNAFPHQLSGGMKQRVVIAMAISLKPSLIIADEPTTSLDVITQYRIIEELKRLRDTYKLSIISISHDVSLISNISDRIIVMYAGRVIEKIPQNSFEDAQHPYTYLLIESIPKIAEDVSDVLPIRGAPPGLTERTTGCPFYERCDYHTDLCLEDDAIQLRTSSGTHEVACIVLPLKNKTKNRMHQKRSDPFILGTVRARPVIVAKNLTKIFRKKTGIRELAIGDKSDIIAVQDVSLTVNEGESVALVGETGSGKTTLSRILGLLETPTSGTLEISGRIVDFSNSKTTKEFRKLVQTIFQDPFQSINPRFPVRYIVSEPLTVNHMADDEKDQESRVRIALQNAELTPVSDYIDKYPHQLSGGQRQRVSIARGLILNPKILIADEPISMLDVSLRAGILNLLRKLREQNGVTLFYITHDIASAKYISDRVYVLYKGQIVESGSTEEIIRYGSHPYTIALIISSMGIGGSVLEKLGNRIFEQVEEHNLPSCKFAPRCPFSRAKCFSEVPPTIDIAVDHLVRCHFAQDIYRFTRDNSISPELDFSKINESIVKSEV